MPFDARDFAVWCEVDQVSPETRKLIEKIMKSPPARRVAGGAGNVRGRFPSRKMGVTIQFESHRGEFALVHEYEYDDDVLAYFDQPPPITLDYKHKSGKHLVHRETTDYFVIRQRSAGWEEYKHETRLLQLAEKMPNRYVQRADGKWSCPPGENYASDYGLYYRIRSSKEINHVKFRNSIFLEDYLRGSDSLKVEEERKALIYALITSRPGILVRDLIEEAKPATADDVYTMLIMGEIYIDLDEDILSEYHRTQVYINKDVANAYRYEKPFRYVDHQPLSFSIQIGKILQWDGIPFLVVNIGRQSVWLRSPEGVLTENTFASIEELVRQEVITLAEGEPKQDRYDAAVALIKASRAKDLESANKRLKLISPYLLNSGPSKDISRNMYNWLEAYRQAEMEYGFGFVGLLPKYKYSGNRTQKIPDETRDVILRYLAEEVLNKKKPKVNSVYSKYLVYCEERNLPVASYKTFQTLLDKHYTKKERVEATEGPRAAYQYDDFVYYLEYEGPRHGDRPFEQAHVDHTPLDLEFVDSETGRINLGRAWLTILIDAFSRYILAYYLSFDPPSRSTFMMVVRECVRRHGRLPQMFVTDGGPDFESIYAECLLGFHNITKKTRPKDDPKEGSVLERLFGTVNTQVIYNMAGNTQLTKKVRLVTESFNPKKNSIWNLPTFYEHFGRWVDTVYHVNRHPSLGQSPADCLAYGMELGGERLHNIIPYNESFIFMTMPTTPKGTAKIRNNHAVKINNIYYTCPEFKACRDERVDVRFDPFDIGIAYAFVGKEWVKLYSEYYQELAGYTFYELTIASKEIKKKLSTSTAQANMNARRLGTFLNGITEAEKELHKIKIASRENKIVRDMIAGGAKGAGKQKLYMPEVQFPQKQEIQFLSEAITIGSEPDTSTYEELA